MRKLTKRQLKIFEKVYQENLALCKKGKEPDCLPREEMYRVLAELWERRLTHRKPFQLPEESNHRGRSAKQPGV